MSKCAISNPVYSSNTTAMCRLILILTMSELKKRGYNVYSVTTDGFITDCENPNIVNNVLGYEDSSSVSNVVHNLLVETRREITRAINPERESPIYYEIKHNNTSFFNIATRTNVATNADGVIARGGSSVEKNNSVMISTILNGNFKVTKDNILQTRFLSVVNGDTDYSIERVGQKTIFMDYDYKRCPTVDSMEKVHISKLVIEDSDTRESKEYQFNNDLVNFDTRLFKDILEFRQCKEHFNKYRKVTNKVLSIDYQDLKDFVESDFNMLKLTEANKLVLFLCLDIKNLDKSLNQKTILEAVNKTLDFNFTRNIFKNQKNIIDLEKLKNDKFDMNSYNNYLDRVKETLNIK